MHISCFLWRNVVIKFPVHCEGICYTQCNVTLKLTHIIEKKIASVLKIATVFFSLNLNYSVVGLMAPRRHM